MKEGAFDEACKGATYVLHTGESTGHYCMVVDEDCIGDTCALHTGWQGKTCRLLTGGLRRVYSHLALRWACPKA